MDQTINYFDQFTQFCWLYGPRTLTSIVLFFGGLWLIRRLTNGFDNFLRVRKVDESLRPFFTSLADTGMKIVLVLMVANTMGLQITSFIAIFSAIAFSIGLALQGSLGNFASGILILLFRPYKAGDLITVGGHSGKVSEIQIFNTTLMTAGGKKVIIPNGKITENPIETIAENAEVLAEISILVQANSSLEWLRATTEDIVSRLENVLANRKPEVKVAGITRDDMKVQIGCWVLGKHYEDTRDRLYEQIKSGFEKAGIELAKERRKESV
jgi:small conductance mechanosensitive channel